MRPDSFFNNQKTPETFFVSDITSVLSSSGVSPTGIDDFNENYAKDSVNVSTMTTKSFMSNLVKIEDTGNSNYLSNIRYAAGATFDSIFSPNSTRFSDTGYFSNFEVPTNKNQPNSLTLNPFNPNNELTFYYASTGSLLYSASITGATPSADELAKSGEPSGWLNYGHNISASVVGTGIGESGEYPYDLNFEKDFYGRKKVEVERIRSVGLRSPMVVTGWGFDLNGNPVPADTGDNTKFASGAFSDVANWKSGPVDLRWDDERKVWAAGGGNTEIMKFTVDEVPPQIGQNATACEFVNVTVIDIGCSSSVNAIGDTGVKVYDDDLCFFNLPVTLLRGLKGTAERFVNPFADDDTDTDCILEAAAEGACRWVVTGLCCNEEIVTS